MVRVGASRRAVLMAGPTASGKSAAALGVARALGGLIVNADAMQVYRELQVLTARPGPEELALAPHRLYGHVPAAAGYSTGRWLIDAAAAIAEAWERRLVAIVVGGTGLYFRSLEKGLVDLPRVPDGIREKWRQALTEYGAEALHAELAARSPDDAARIRPSDAQRLARALEVLDATGEPLSAHQRRQARGSVLAGAEVARIAIIPDRDWLYRRCDERFLHMMEEGALDEVRRLLALDLDPALPAMKAIGVPPLARYLMGEIGLDEAIRIGQRDTRNYAKRQLTWLRHQMPGFSEVPDAAAALTRTLDLCRRWA